MVEIPVGNIAKIHNGGPKALDPIVTRVKKFGFTGYIRIFHPAEDGTEGFVFFIDGDIKLHLHSHTDGSRKTVGQQALKNIRQDASLLNSLVEIHTGVDVLNIIEGLDKTPATAATRRSSRRAVLAWGKTAKGEDDAEKEAIRARLEEIKKCGYTLNVDEVLEGEMDEIRKKVTVVENSIHRLEEARNQLIDLEPMLERGQLSTIEPLLYDVTKVYDVERALRALEREADKTKKRGEQEKAAVVVEEIEQRKQERERKEKTGQVYDLMLKQQSGQDPPPNKEAVAEIKHFIAKLHPNYKFDNYVVGNSNHFAHAASVAVAEDPATTYNPLFIWSGPGLGKTHLLNAIANHIMQHHPTMKITYFTTEQFIRDLVSSMKGGKLDEFRKAYREADILIVDDVQFLAESERGQEEFFHTFNSLFTVDKQIVLASDRPPKEIATLKQRLVSRFEGGLIVEIQQPDYETRLAILAQKAHDKKFDVKEDVLALIARSITSNIRELEGALNKVMAFSSFTKRESTPELAREVLKDLMVEEIEKEKEIEAPPTKEQKDTQASSKDTTTKELTQGHSYLVEEHVLKGSVQLFKHTLEKEEKKGLAVVRTNPTRVERENKVKHLAELYWLTDRDSKKSKTIEPSLEKLMWEMSGFIDDNEGGILLLDGLDYLVSSNTFDSVTHFIRRIVDAVAETESILIVSLSPDTMEKQQVKILEREMDVIKL